MIYVSMVLCACVSTAFSLMFLKTYQLSSYKTRTFFKEICAFNFSSGNKNKIVFTKRIIRFLITLFLLNMGIFYLINRFVSNVWLLLLDYLIVLVMCPLIMIVAHFVICPLEEFIKWCYIQRARKKLLKKNVIKIGITGSYGKTSTKNILTELLEKEYKVCTTPLSYNTEMGITKTILESLDDHDVFIAEMGARKKGDIKVLTDIVKPDYGIITTVGKQHIESFKTLSVIEDTKFELAENVSHDGAMVFNGDSPSGVRLFKRCKTNKYLVCDKRGFAYAQNEKITSEGCEFELVLDGQIIKMKTALLGKCNIDNIVCACAMARLLGISDEDMISAVKKLKPISHRLEIIKNDYCTILDDSYNSNLVGAKEALNVLSHFEGQKIVITPGFVEMGEAGSMSNFALGASVADVADYIVIMNEINKNYLFSGAISHNFDKNKIFFCSTREKQKEIINLISTKGCVILFENDLPDNFK